MTFADDSQALARLADDGCPNFPAEEAHPTGELYAATSSESTIYTALADHQQGAEGWDFSETLHELHRYKAAFWKEICGDFKIDLPDLAFCIQSLPASSYAQYRGKYNGFGLKREIAFNSKYLGADEATRGVVLWDVLGTLLHEMIHVFQDATGTSGGRCHHNKQFREIALMLGLVVDKSGQQKYLKDSRFFEILSADDRILLPDMDGEMSEIPQTEKKAGKSTLKKWTCGCQSIRSGKADLFIRCTRPGCGNEFRLEGSQKVAETDAKNELASEAKCDWLKPFDIQPSAN